MTTVSIKGLDRAAVLAALYNAAKPVGLGIVHFTPNPMTVEVAQRIIDALQKDGRKLYFDYVGGRPLKVSLAGETIDTGLYDRDQGQGKGEAIIATLRASK